MGTETGSGQKGPVILDLEGSGLPPAPSPADAPPITGTGAESAARLLHRASRPGFRLGRTVVWLASGLMFLAVGVVTHDFVNGLYERSLWLGTIGFALSLGLVLVLVVFVVHEGAALARLSRIDALRKQALSLDTRRLLPGLKRLYADRPQLAAAAQTVQKAVRESPDAETLIATAERAYLTALDRDAELAVSSAARDVAAATALIPMPAVDVAAVLWINLRMIRRVGEVYGGRSGWFGSLRLLRAVATHLIATGAIAATDDVLGPLIGGGILGTLSRRFGEAAVNAALTARVGVAAIEVCRPMPYQHLAAPRASGLVAHALRGWRATKPEA
ncbi:MAG: TIGR01620 family protein [Pseudomonadota bacterium]